MAKIRVLMLGWEFPPLMSGGLGVACEGLAKALSKTTELSLILPEACPSLSARKAHFIPFSQLSHAKLEQLLPNAQSQANLHPYWDGDLQDSLAEGLYQGNLREKVMNFAEEAQKIAQHTSFDVIHAHDWMTAIAGIEIRKQTGRPLIFHAHSLSYDRAGPMEEGWIHGLEKRVIREADLIIAVSEYSRQVCLNHYEAVPWKTVVIHNGITPVRSFRTPKPFPEKLVLFLGRMTRQKGPEHFLAIAKEVLKTRPDVRFVMAGTGEQLHSLMADSVRLGIAGQIHFTGFLDRKNVQQLLSMTDVYCMPSVSEPFGLSALEAAQFGVPSVLSKHSGVAEILCSAKTANPGHASEMAVAIIEQLGAGIVPEPARLRGWTEAAQEIMPYYLGIL